MLPNILQLAHSWLATKLKNCMHRSILITCTLLASCAAPVYMSAGLAAKLPDDELCATYGARRSMSGYDLSPLIAEIHRRHLIRDSFIRAFKGKDVVVGMAELEVICTWGRPTYVRSTSKPDESSKEWVYKRDIPEMLGGTGYSFVYFRTGAVTEVRY